MKFVVEEKNYFKVNEKYTSKNIRNINIFNRILIHKKKKNLNTLILILYVCDILNILLLCIRCIINI